MSARHASAVALGTLVIALAAAPAAAQTTVALDAQAAIGYSSNPFLVSGDDDRGSWFTELTVQPELLYQDELGDAGIIGHYRRTDYFDRYDSADSYGAEARARRQLSQTLTGRASVAYDSSILGQGGAGIVGVVDPTLPPDVGTPDITLLGLRQRQESVVATMGADWRVSERDTANAEVRVSNIDYGDGPLLTSSRTVSGTVGYSRSVSQRTSVGAQVSGSWVDFGRNGYSGQFYQPQLTLTHQVSETLRFSIGAGPLFVVSKTDRGTERSTGFSGNFFGCHDGDRATACVRAYSDAQPTGLGDISKRWGGAFDYSYVVREFDILRASVDYSHVSETSSLLQVPSISYLTAGATYEHGFSRRWFAGVSGSYRQADGNGFERTSDVGVKFFIRTRLGDTK